MISFNPSQNGSRVKVRSSCFHNVWKPTHPQYIFNYFIKFGGELPTRGKREGGGTRWQETSACRSTDFSKFCLQFLTNYLFNSVLSTSRTIENNFNMHQGFGFNEIILI